MLTNVFYHQNIFITFKISSHFEIVKLYENKKKKSFDPKVNGGYQHF